MSEDEIGRLLRDHGLRVTPQRRAILEAFRGGRNTHLSADDVLTRASVAVPDLGRGTVYATLAELADLGVLASTGHPEPVRYETNLDRHGHFRCGCCLRLFDVELSGDRGGIEALDGHTVDRITVEAEGTCSDCHAYERGLAAGLAQIQRVPRLRGDALAQLSARRVHSPLGELACAASADGVVRIAFEDHADFAAVSERARRPRGPAAARTRLSRLGTAIEGYFGGDRGPLSDAVDWRLTTPEQRRVLVAIQEIVYARPRSYDKLGAELTAYDCGRLIGANPVPLLVPCHRVSCGNQVTDGYVGGSVRRELLAQLESGA